MAPFLDNNENKLKKALLERRGGGQFSIILHLIIIIDSEIKKGKYVRAYQGQDHQPGVEQK